MRDSLSYAQGNMKERNAGWQTGPYTRHYKFSGLWANIRVGLVVYMVCGCKAFDGLFS